MSPEEIELLVSDDAQEYIFANTNEDETKLLLRHKSILGVPASLIAQQIAARKKVETKIPFFYKTKGVVYPPSLNLEQTSSEATARFKTAILRKEINREKLIACDLTGGWGVDSFFLSQITEGLDYVEPESMLFTIAHLNHSLLNKGISHYNKTAENFLKSTLKKYDFIFLDPSRRDSKSKKVVSLTECSPDITGLLPFLFQRTDFVLLKASPLLDIKQGINELTQVKKVIVVSVVNECKELLFLLQKDFEGEALVETYNLDSEGKVKHNFNFTFSEETTTISDFSPPQNYLYEPNASILKSGAFKSIGKKFGLSKIHVSTHFYTSTALQKDFPGRIFKIDEADFNLKSLTGGKANIITRNYPLTTAELKKKLKLKDGGDKFVIAFSGQKKKYTLLATGVA